MRKWDFKQIQMVSEECFGDNCNDNYRRNLSAKAVFILPEDTWKTGQLGCIQNK